MRTDPTSRLIKTATRYSSGRASTEPSDVSRRARSATGTLSATQTLSDSGQNAFSPVVVVDQSGNAIFAWSREDGTTACGQFGCERIQTRVRSAAGALSAVQTLTDGGRTAIRPAVAVDQNGN